MKRLVFLVIGLSLIWGFTSAQSLVNINGDWLFHYAENIEKADSIANSGFYRVDYDATNFQKTPVPSCWAILGYEEPIYRGFKKQNDLASEGFYIHRFTLPESFNGKKVWLHFGGVWASAEVWMNGVWVGRHDSGYTSFHLDVTSEAKAEEDTEEKLQEEMNPALDAEYLTGVWVWQEELSPDSITKMRSFELYADGTGKVIAFETASEEDEKMLSASLTWEIESHDSWSSLHLFSDVNLWNCNYELSGNYLMDLTGSDFFAKE